MSASASSFASALGHMDALVASAEVSGEQIPLDFVVALSALSERASEAVSQAEAIRKLSRCQLIALASVSTSRTQAEVFASQGISNVALAQASAMRQHPWLQSIKPLPSWCADEVMLSVNLLPSLLDSLELSHANVARVCSQYRVAWAALLHRRRYLHPKPLRVLEMPMNTVGCLQDGKWLLAAERHADCCSLQCAALQTTQGTTQTFAVVAGGAPWAALGPIDIVEAKLTPEAVFLIQSWADPDHYADHGHVLKLRLDGTELARSAVMSDLQGLVVVDAERILAFNPRNIHVLDARTLKQSLMFGEFDNIWCCAMGDGGVIVADIKHRGLLTIYSLTGELLRTLRGDFGGPERVLMHENRIYVIDTAYYRDDGPGEGAWSRLVVLDSQTGAVHQVVSIMCGAASVDEDMEDPLKMFFHDGDLHVECCRESQPGPPYPSRIRVFGVCPPHS